MEKSGSANGKASYVVENRPMNAPRDLVSIVIVAYNNWPDLELAIQSALNQSYQPVEVIVVDNDSTDQTSKEVPTRFAGSLRYVRQPNLGDGGAYNAGVRIAEGDFLQFIDGDDFIAPDKVEKQMQAMRSHPEADIVYGDVRQFQSNAGAATWTDWDTFHYENIFESFLDPKERNPGPLVHSVLFRRRAIEHIGPWDQTLYIVDQDYWLRASWLGCRFHYCPGALCFYRRHSRQMSNDSAAMMSGTEQVWKKALTYIGTEPMRSGLLARLAHLQLVMAIRRYGLSRSAAWAKLAEARRTCPEAVPALAYFTGAFVILLPGGSTLARSDFLSRLRRWLARWLGA